LSVKDGGPSPSVRNIAEQMQHKRAVDVDALVLPVVHGDKQLAQISSVKKKAGKMC
jgi:hypothetical protein